MPATKSDSGLAKAVRKWSLGVFERSFTRNARLSRRFMPRGRLALAALAFVALMSLDPTRESPQVFLGMALGFVSVFVISHLLTPSHGKLSLARRLPPRCIQGEPFEYSILAGNLSRRISPPSDIRDYGVMRFPSMEDWERHSGSAPFLDELGGFDRAIGYPQWFWLTEGSQEIVSGEAHVPSLRPGETVELRRHAVSMSRGVRHFSGFSIGTPDAMGLFRRLSRRVSRESVICWPAPIRMDEACLRHDGASSDAAGSPGFGENDDGEIKGLRQWRHGDPLKQIDWKASAKSGTLLARERFPAIEPLTFLVFLPSGDESADGHVASVCHGMALDPQRHGIGAVASVNGASGLSEGGMAPALDILALARRDSLDAATAAHRIASAMEASPHHCRGAVMAFPQGHETFADEAASVLRACGFPCSLLPLSVPVANEGGVRS